LIDGLPRPRSQSQSTIARFASCHGTPSNSPGDVSFP